MFSYIRLSNCFCLLLFAISACTTAPKEKFYMGTTVPRHPPNEVWINNSAEPQHLDPQLTTGVPDNEIVHNIFARLTQINPATGKPLPDLAERWEISEDGTEYTFYMRKSNVWSDGHPLTAHDVTYAWERLINPETGAEYASAAYDIVNAEPYNQKALFVTGFSAAKTVQEVQDAFAKVIPVDRVAASKTPQGFYVYIGGNPEDSTKNRTKAIEKLHGQVVLSDTLVVRETDASHLQFKAIDDYTLWVKLRGPLPYFLYLMEFSPFAPTPRHVVEKIKKTVKPGQEEAWIRAENITCSGPYCIEEERFRQYKIFKKNPLYWDAKNVRIEKVKVLQIESYNTAVFFYQTGEIDWIGNGGQLPTEFVKPATKHWLDFHNDPYLGVYFYAFNINKKPLDDVRVRKALSLAVDREGLTHLLGGGQLPYASLVPDGLAGYKGLNLPIYDVEKARKLLAEAGFPGGKGFPKLNIMYNTTEMHKQVAEAVQQMLKKNLNVDIELQNREWKIYLDDMTSRNYEIVRRGWIGDYPDPYTFLDLLHTSSGNNRTGWSNKKYDNLLAAANMEIDLDKRLQILREAEAIAMDEIPFFPFFVYTSPYIKKPYLKGFWPNIQNHHWWKHWWIDERWYKGIPKEPIEDLPRMTIEGAAS